MAYFDNFPKVSLLSFSDNRSSSSDYVESTNIFKRGKIRDDFFQVAATFDRFSIRGDDRPDNVANILYGNPELDWIILLSNNILNIRDEWPMNGMDFQRYIDNNYSPEQLAEVHHYETVERRDPEDKLLQQSGLVVDGNSTFTYSYKGINYTDTGTTSVSYLEYETQKNDAKRNIFALKSMYIDTIMEDMRDILTYEDSSQYINRKMKKGDNLRLLALR
jgi:hypothetical protein